MRFPRTIGAWQYLVAGTAVAVSITFAWKSLWPFDLELPAARSEPSVWEVLLHDRLVLGFLRLALTLVALYTIASIPALIMAGRWLKGFGSSGLSVDDVREADETIGELRRQLELSDRNLDEAVALAISLNEENEDLRKENEVLTEIVDDLESRHR